MANQTSSSAEGAPSQLGDYVSIMGQVTVAPAPGNRANNVTVKLNSGVTVTVPWTDIVGPSGQSIPLVGDLVTINGVISSGAGSSTTTDTPTVTLTASSKPVVVGSSKTDIHTSRSK